MKIGCIGRGLSSISSKIDCNSHLFYLMKYIKTTFEVSNDSGTVFGSITKEELYNIRIVKPLSDVIENFNIKIQKVDREIMLKCNEIALLRNLKEMLLSRITIGGIK